MNFSNMLVNLRKESNLSQKQLAENIGVSQSAIAKLEIGRNEATASTLIKLANYFQCSVDFLLEREDDFGNITITPGTDFSAEEIQLVKDYRELTPALKEMLHGILSSWKPAQANGESAQRGNRRA